jgi:hypothetical protein
MLDTKLRDLNLYRVNDRVGLHAAGDADVGPVRQPKFVRAIPPEASGLELEKLDTEPLGRNSHDRL